MASYFTNNRRGEIPELETELNSTKFERKREAVKKIIAAMTVGKDVSNLFPHVVKCMETTSLELKKLVYLYIINYAKSQPDLALMAVNSFRKDARQTTNPLIRALAVRTMGCLRVEKITEYLCEPLKDALNDDDPYVRKTAAICVAKLYDSAPALVEEYELIDLLNGLLVDGNAMVVANAVISLKEISKMRGSNVIVLDNNTINKLVAAMNECTEWGQAFILETIGDYSPVDVREAETIIERVAPRLAHGNSAVTLGSVRVIIKYMDYLTSTESIRNWCRKLTPPLVTLLSAEPEIQYVALKNINLIVQKRPNILDKEIRVFFCKYNDPVYIKMEKVDIMVRLADNKNIDQVLHEFKEYATEVDVDFVKKSVRAVGRCAIKLERASERCVQCLLDLIMLRVNYVVQEAVIVIKDIFRKYPNRYEMIIKDLFEQLESLDDPEAKSSMIWIIGEYAERIDDADSQLSNFLSNFHDEPSQVQLALLTATVKLFLKKPEEAEGMITQLLTMATEECQNPDLRDRAYIYWRLLSTDPEVTKQVVLGEKPTISDDSYMIDSQILDKLIEQLSTLSSIYHKPAESMFRYTHEQHLDAPEAAEEAYVYDDSTGQTGQTEFYGIGMEANDYMGDLLGFDEEPKKAKVPYQTVLTAETPGQGGRPGVQVDMAFQREGNSMSLSAKVQNFSEVVLQDFAIQFNTNTFALAPVDMALSLSPISPGETQTTSIPISNTGQPDSNPPSVPFIVQMALKTNLDVFYFQAPCMLSVLMSETGKISGEEFKTRWTSVPDTNEFSHDITSIHLSYQSKESLQSRLEANNIFFITERATNEGVAMYFSTVLINGMWILCELRSGNFTSVSASCRPEHAPLAPLFIQAISFLVSNNY